MRGLRKSIAEWEGKPAWCEAGVRHRRRLLFGLLLLLVAGLLAPHPEVAAARELARRRLELFTSSTGERLQAGVTTSRKGLEAAGKATYLAGCEASASSCSRVCVPPALRQADSLHGFDLDAAHTSGNWLNHATGGLPHAHSVALLCRFLSEKLTVGIATASRGVCAAHVASCTALSSACPTGMVVPGFVAADDTPVRAAGQV